MPSYRPVDPTVRTDLRNDGDAWAEMMAGANILLTGGTGSFGTAFVERVLNEYPDTIVRVFSRDELKQSELRARFGDKRVRYFIGDVRDRARLTRACEGATAVVHAAAMKQVPACEYNPFEAINTNILGAQNVVDAAMDAGVGRVIALSTDKAANPLNLYGATKLCAEKIFVQGNSYSAPAGTRVACVRYGNVVGSRGSVVPLFKRQIAEGRLTITDPRMTRFWITLDHAVDLVLYGLTNLTGGEIFIPKIPSMRVVDLAEAVGPELPKEIIGIRPGEKLHEVLLTEDDASHAVDMGALFVVLPLHQSWATEPRWADGDTLPDGFCYTSDTNSWWLSPTELRTMLDAASYERRGATLATI